MKPPTPTAIPRRALGFFRLALICVFLPLLAFANSDERVWTLESGTSFCAALVRYDEAAGQVILRFNESEDRTYAADLFGAMDRAWLAEWAELTEKLDAEVAKLGGRFVHLATTGAYPTDLYVYYPSSAKASAPLPPGMILFHPSAKASYHVKRHMEAAEAAGMVLVGCGSFRNTYTEAKDIPFQARFAEIFPQILARVRLDPARLFMGGISGGASRAFDFSVRTAHPWAGIYSNGGWLGGRENYALPYPAGMRVAIVNGNLDQAANQWVAPDGAVLRKAGCAVGVISFEGGHQIPPVHTQLLAFKWLLDQVEAP